MASEIEDVILHTFAREAEFLHVLVSQLRWVLLSEDENFGEDSWFDILDLSGTLNTGR